MTERTDNPDVQHETSDVNVAAILTFGGGLLAIGLVVFFIIWLLYGYFSARPTPTSAEQYPLAAGQSQVPPEPRLQVTPRQDLQDLRAAENKTLNSYEWVDRNAGIVRIPIEQAMKRTLERGLPARRQAEAPK